MDPNIKKSGGKREFFPDVVKGIAIIVVVWGHAIQYWHGEGYDYWWDPFFILIYSFHMPLFALVSGYFAIKSIQKAQFILSLKKRIQILLIPYTFWGICWNSIGWIKLFIQGNASLGEGLKATVKGAVISPLWFLLATWVGFFLIALTEKVTSAHKGWRYVFYGIIGASAMVVPNIPHRDTIGFVLPFFFLGAAYGRNHESNERIPGRSLAVFAVFFLFLLALWKKDAYVYTTGIYLFSHGEPFRQMGLNIYRFLIGLFGSLSFIGVLQRLPYEKMSRRISKYGRDSGAIYILSTIMFLLSQRALDMLNLGFIDLKGINICISIALIPVSILVAYLCGKMAKLIRKNKVMTQILLGK